MITKWQPAAMAGILLLSAGSLIAQSQGAPLERTASAAEAYDVGREQTLVGTVLTFSNTSQRSPFGPRLTLETASGVIDIHLGDARTLSEHHFAIQAGDTLRIVGETVRLPNNTSQFLARILQKGDQAVAVRTAHGFPIPPTTPAEARDGKQQRGAM